MRSVLLFLLLLISVVVGQPTLADISVNKAGPDPMIIGYNGTYEYQINIANAGADASNVVMNDIVPPPLVVTSVLGAYSAGSNLCSNVGNNVTCRIPLLFKGDTARSYVRVSIPSNASPATVNNTAVVSTSTPESQTTNNINSHIAHVIRSADLAVKIEGPTTAIAGQATELTRIITAFNGGYSDADNVVVTYHVTAPLEYVSSTNSACSYSAGTRLVTCNVGTMVAGATFQFTVNEMVPPNAVDVLPSGGGTVNSTAIVTSSTFDPNPSNNMDQHQTIIQIDADLAVTKAGPQEVVAGASLPPNPPASYTIVVDNSGPSNALGVRMTDPVPPQFRVVGVNGTCEQAPSATKRQGPPCPGNPTPNCTFDANTNNVVCDIGGLRVRDRVTITLYFTVAADIPAGTNVTNIAYVSGTTPESDLSRNQDPHSTIVRASADVVVQKTGPLTPITAGDGATYTWTIRVANQGPTVANNVMVIDNIPAQLTVSGQASVNRTGATCTNTGNSFSCSLGTLQPGDAVLITIPFTVAGNAQPLGNVVNCVNVTTTSPETNTANNNACATANLIGAPDVAIAKSVSQPVINVGDRGTFYWSIAVTNNGPSTAMSVRVTDTIPAPLVAQAPVTTTGGNCTLTGNQLTCDLGNMAPNVGSPVRITVPFTVPVTAPNGTVTNTAVVTTTSTDTNLANNQASASVTLLRQADVSISKTGPGLLCAGTPEQRYTITVTNNGPVEAAGVTVTDVLPAPFDVGTGAYNTTNGTCSWSGRTFSCSLGNMAVGASVTMTFPFLVSPNTPAQSAIINTVVVNTTSYDNNLANNQATWSTNICSVADLGIAKTGPANVTAGSQSTYSYSLNVTNFGPATATSVTITDTVPAEFPISGTPSATGGGSCSISSQRTVSCTWPGSFAVGRSEQVTILFTVAATQPASSVTNCATVTSTPANEPSPDTLHPNQACATTLIGVVVDVSINKSGPSRMCAGSPGDFFTIRVRNTGQSLATGVVVTDTLPSQFTPGAAAQITISGQAQGATPTCSFSGQTLSCQLGSLAGGAADIVIRYPFSIAAGTPSGFVNNTASVTSTVQETTTTNNSDTHTTEICNLAGLSIVKIAPATVEAGSTDVYQFQLTVSNAGPSISHNVVVTDPSIMVADFQIVSVSSAQGASCQTTGTTNQTVTCTYPQLAANSSDVITIRFRVPTAAVGGDRTNCGFVTSETPTGPGPLQSCVPIRIIAAVDVSVTKTGPSSMCAGTPEQRYTITVTNNGPANALAVTVTDPLPAPFEIGTGAITVSGNQTATPCSWSGRTLTCTLGNTTVGSSVIITYPAVVPSTAAVQQHIVNTATVTTASAENNTANNQASWQTDICNIADLGITKAGPPNVTAGSTTPYTYTLNVTNYGPSQATSVTITDVVPDQVAIAGTATATGGGSCTITAQRTVSCLWPGVFAVGRSEQVSIQFTVDARQTASSITNCANVTSNPSAEPVPDVHPNQACVTTPLGVSVDVGVEKTGPSRICAGAPGDFFTVRVRNVGSSLATGVTLSDVLPAQFTPGASSAITITGQESTTAACSFSGQSLSCQLGDLTPQTGLITIRYPFSCRPTFPPKTSPTRPPWPRLSSRRATPPTLPATRRRFATCPCCPSSRRPPPRPSWQETIPSLSLSSRPTTRVPATLATSPLPIPTSWWPTSRSWAPSPRWAPPA